MAATARDFLMSCAFELAQKKPSPWISALARLRLARECHDCRTVTFTVETGLQSKAFEPLGTNPTA